MTEENARADDFARSVDTSLTTLDLDYVDLLLIHWPQPQVPLAETLGALAKAKRDGLARHIGVSNFTVALVDEAVAICPEPLVTNQIEYHAYLRQDKVIDACARHGLSVTCYAPLARGRLLDDPVLGDIAAVHHKTAAQVALRWLVQQPGIAVVPALLNSVRSKKTSMCSISGSATRKWTVLRPCATRTSGSSIPRCVVRIGTWVRCIDPGGC